MSAVFVKATLHEPGSADLTGLHFTVALDRGTAIVSVHGIKPVPFQDRFVAYQAVIEDLGTALLQAAQNPKDIAENHKSLG